MRISSSICFKTNYKPEDNLAQVETRSSIK